MVKRGIERRRLVYPAELELLLRCAGFDILGRWGDLAQAPFVDPVTQEYNYLICKATGAHMVPDCKV